MGPGWAELAGRVWDFVTAAGGRVIQVKGKGVRLTLYFRGRGEMWNTPLTYALRAQLEQLGVGVEKFLDFDQ